MADPMIPLGGTTSYKPLSLNDESRLHQLVKMMLP